MGERPLHPLLREPGRGERVRGPRRPGSSGTSTGGRARQAPGRGRHTRARAGARPRGAARGQGPQDLLPGLRGLLLRKVADVKAVDGVSFTLKRGEVLGLVGESRAAARPRWAGPSSASTSPPPGSIVFDGQDITHLKERQMKPLRKKMAYIFQDPYGSLDPRQSAGSIIGEPIKVHKTGMTKSRAPGQGRRPHAASWAWTPAWPAASPTSSPAASASA